MDAQKGDRGEESAPPWIMKLKYYKYTDIRCYLNNYEKMFACIQLFARSSSFLSSSSLFLKRLFFGSCRFYNFNIVLQFGYSFYPYFFIFTCSLVLVFHHLLFCCLFQWSRIHLFPYSWFRVIHISSINWSVFRLYYSFATLSLLLLYTH